MPAVVYDLEMLVHKAQRLKIIRREQVKCGDHLYIKTVNSLYVLESIPEGYFSVRGGWFDLHGLAPAIRRVTGCTWGGSAIAINTIAAPGLCLEFDNRVVTSPIQKVWLLPVAARN